MEMVGNHSFTLTTGNGKRSRLRCLKKASHKDLSRRSSSTPTPPTCQTTVSRKYAYVDDPTIMHADGDWQAVEGVLTKDMATIGEYLQTWKLKLSTTKTVLTAFHVKNKEAKREMKVNFNNKTLSFCSELKYLGVMLDRLLTCCWHLASLCKKLTSRIALLRQLVDSGCGAGATTLRIATLALVHSTAE